MTLSVLIAFATMGFLAAALWSVLCRVNLMRHRVTKDRVFIQHSLLAFGLLGGLILTDPFSKLSLATGVCAFLWLGASRWKFGAPPGTSKPMEPTR